MFRLNFGEVSGALVRTVRCANNHFPSMPESKQLLSNEKQVYSLQLATYNWPPRLVEHDAFRQLGSQPSLSIRLPSS